MNIHSHIKKILNIEICIRINTKLKKTKFCIRLNTKFKFIRIYSKFRIRLRALDAMEFVNKEQNERTSNKPPLNFLVKCILTTQGISQDTVAVK